MGKIEIILSKRIFKEDFLDTEVKKNLAVKGGFICDKIKPQYSGDYAYYIFSIAEQLRFICEYNNNDTVKFTVSNEKL